MILPALLHLDEAPDAEEVPTGEPDGLEGDAGADGAGVVVDMGNNGEEDFADGLHEEMGK